MKLLGRGRIEVRIKAMCPYVFFIKHIGTHSFLFLKVYLNLFWKLDSIIYSQFIEIKSSAFFFIIQSPESGSLSALPFRSCFS